MQKAYRLAGQIGSLGDLRLIHEFIAEKPLHRGTFCRAMEPQLNAIPNGVLTGSRRDD